MRTTTILYHVRRRQQTIILLLLLMTGMFLLFKVYGLQKPIKYIPSRFNFFSSEEPTPPFLETDQAISNVKDKNEPFPKQHIDNSHFEDVSPPEKDVSMNPTWNALNEFQVEDIRMMSIPEDPNRPQLKEPFILTGQTSAFENLQIPPPLGFPNSYEMNNELVTQSTTPMKTPNRPKDGKEAKIALPALPVFTPKKTIGKIHDQLSLPPVPKVAGPEGVILNRSFKNSTTTSAPSTTTITTTTTTKTTTPTTTTTTERIQEQKKPFLIQKMYERQNGTTPTETSTLDPVKVSRGASKLLFKNKKKPSQGELLDTPKFKSTDTIGPNNGTDSIPDNEPNTNVQLSAPTTNGGVEPVEVYMESEEVYMAPVEVYKAPAEDYMAPAWGTEKQMEEGPDDVEIFEVNNVIKKPRKTEFGVK